MMCYVVCTDSRSGKKKGFVRWEPHREGAYLMRILVSGAGSFYGVGSRLGRKYVVVSG